MATARQREILKIKAAKKRSSQPPVQVQSSLSQNSPLRINSSPLAAPGTSGNSYVTTNRNIERPRPPKLPQFAKKNVKLWFAQCEAMFRSARMIDDEDKYSCVIGMLEMDVTEQVHFLVMNPPEYGKYEALKKELILKFSDSLCERQDKLANMELGLNKPSYLLTQMQAIGHDLVSEPYLRNLWLRRLPDPLRTVLAATNEPLAVLASTADELASLGEDSGRLASLHEGKTSEVFELEKQIAMLTTQVAALKTHMAPQRPGKENTEANWCRFHRQFGHRAYRCVAPCAFPKND
ncbi:hypothetical protein GE061_011026 [Apolygus lucorum]|uniref:DUF7041 domain-containing protein n=1 Tax=Apolygus lucorum TaxID=248454 RepID=A0A8S9XYG8_APOLU|nr:hypothetical protein GE061_011026 [Apolygus lucorum]